MERDAANIPTLYFALFFFVRRANPEDLCVLKLGWPCIWVMHRDVAVGGSGKNEGPEECTFHT